MEKLPENTIKIILDEPYFIVGEHIKGKLQLNIVKDYPIHKLDIRFIGKEKLVIYGKRLRHIIADTSSILEENKTNPELKTYVPKVFKPGTYDYPFVFSTIFPNTKTPSAGTYRSFMMRFQVKYILKAYVTTFGTIERSLKTTEKVELLEALKSEHEVEKFVDEQVKGLAFTNGSTSIHTWIDHSGFVLPAGMSIRVICFNNKCTKAVNRINVRLIQEAKTTFPIDAEPLIETDVVGSWVLDGVAAHEDVTVKKRLVVDDMRKATELETCTGNLFEKNYMLTITPIYDAWICRMKPSVTYNLKVTKRLRGKEKSVSIVVNKPKKVKAKHLESIDNIDANIELLKEERAKSLSNPLLLHDDKN